MAPRQVSAATKAMISREEMDAALARLPRLPVAPQNPTVPASNVPLARGMPTSAIQPAALRIQRIDTASAAFLCELGFSTFCANSQNGPDIFLTSRPILKSRWSWKDFTLLPLPENGLIKYTDHGICQKCFKTKRCHHT